MKKLFGLAFAAALLAGAGLAHAANDPTFDGNRGIQPQTSAGGVTYVVGGVELDESQAIKALPGYNLHLTFARNDGAYQSNAKVSVFDAKGQDLLDATADGPLLYAKLPPGSYKVVVDAADGKQMTRTASVGNSGAADVNFIW